MRSVMKSDFFWRFVGGFAIGALGVVTLQPAHAQHHAASAAQAPDHAASAAQAPALVR